MKTFEKGHAAYLLSDEIFKALKDVQLAHRLLSNALDFYIDDDDLQTLGHHEALLRLSEISWRMELMLNQLCGARETLTRLDVAARSYTPESKTPITTTAQRATPKSTDEILARVKELTADLDPAAQQRVLEIFEARLQDNTSSGEE